MDANTNIKKLLNMLSKENTGRILIIDDPNEFLKVLEEMQAQYLERHENGVVTNGK